MGSRAFGPGIAATVRAIVSRFANATVPAGRYPADTTGRRATGAAARLATGAGAAALFFMGPAKTTAAVQNSTTAAMTTFFMVQNGISAVRLTGRRTPPR